MVAATVVVLIAASVHLLGERSGGRVLAFALGLGAVLGVVLQRSRFCFYCHARDYFERGDARGLLAIVAALAVGTVGMHVVMTGWLPVPVPGRLPPDAHIGPVSWALVLAGAAFGLGMVISGSCISAHWYRMGEGSATAPFALLGAALGFVLGFNTWNGLYSATIATAPVVWLPHYVGYAGSAALQLTLLALAAALLWRRLPRDAEP
ncbi:MAG TPA: YeeE/YedE thiosulfate transporter family protein, partial [Burkholderiaceae bacterium]